MSDKARADAIAAKLHHEKWTSNTELCKQLGELPNAVTWYIYQLRERGFMVETAMFSHRAAFKAGARGYRLVGTQDTPYRPAWLPNQGPPVWAGGDHKSKAKAKPLQEPIPDWVPERDRTAFIHGGDRVAHPGFKGVGRVTYASPQAPKVVVKFPRRKYPERLLRTELTKV